MPSLHACCMRAASRQTGHQRTDSMLANSSGQYRLRLHNHMTCGVVHETCLPHRVSGNSSSCLTYSAPSPLDAPWTKLDVPDSRPRMASALLSMSESWYCAVSLLKLRTSTCLQHLAFTLVPTPAPTSTLCIGNIKGSIDMQCMWCTERMLCSVWCCTEWLRTVAFAHTLRAE